MARDGYVNKNIRNVDPAVRAALVGDSMRREASLSDVVGEVIGAAWDITYERSGAKPYGIASVHADQFNISIPQEMVTRIYLISRSRGITESSVVQELLADHYGVDFTPVKLGGATRSRRDG